MTTAKVLFLLDYNLKIFIYWGGEGGVNLSWGGIKIWWGEFFQVGRNEQIFGCWVGLAHPPQ